MRVMGFSVHPGDLPFVTVRGEKWESRVEPGDFVRIRGEPPCDMPARTAVVLSVSMHNGPPPAHVADIYAGQRLYAIELGAPSEPDEELAERYSIPI